MNARVARSARVGAMAEALVHLTQHTHRNVGEVEIAPIDLGLNSVAHGTPAVENRMEVGKYLLADKMLGTIVELEVGGLAGSPVLVGDRFIDQRKEVAVESRIQPRGSLRRLSQPWKKRP